MATARGKGKKGAGGATQVGAPSKRARGAASPSDAHEALAAPARGDVALVLLRELPQLTRVDREAFGSLVDERRCAHLGRQTRSEQVEREASRWLPELARAMRDPNVAPPGYSRARFAWLLECLLVLQRARQERKEQRQRDVARRSAARLALDEAKRAQRELTGTLSVLAGARADEVRALDHARKRARAAAMQSSSFALLLELADAWRARARRDPQTAVLVESSGLSAAHVEALRAMHGELQVHEVALMGAVERIGGRDTPAINEAEGRLLFEMKVARDAFVHARKTNRAVPTLPIGRATRRVLVAHPSPTRAAKANAPAKRAAKGRAAPSDAGKGAKRARGGRLAMDEGTYATRQEGADAIVVR